MSSATLSNRHEILFLYDVSWANPNGDPMDENKPRIDEETGINIVTDVRLKRTVRDALMEMEHEVFLREERKEDGTLKTKEEFMNENYGSPEEVLRRCIDIRLFGGTFALRRQKKGQRKKSASEEESQEVPAFSLTGPVQFKFGHSLHQVKVEFIQGTTVMPSPSERGKRQGTITEVYVVPYSLLAFYGIANEKAAESTGLTDDDLDAMFKAMWVGHKASTDVITRSKFGHEPRLLLDIVYKPGSLTHMGELDKLVAFRSDKNDEAIRDITDGTLDLSALKAKVDSYKGKIEKVRYQIGDRVHLEPALEVLFAGIAMEPFSWSDEV